MGQNRHCHRPAGVAEPVQDLSQELAQKLCELAGFLVLEALIYHDERGGVFLVRAARVFDYDEVGAVGVVKQLPCEALAHERLAEGGAVEARGLAAREGAAHVRRKREVIGELGLEGDEDVGDAAPVLRGTLRVPPGWLETILARDAADDVTVDLGRWRHWPAPASIALAVQPLTRDELRGLRPGDVIVVGSTRAPAR